MGTGSVCFILLIGISIPIVKSKNPFHDYYYNKYHKGSTTSTTTSISEFGTSGSEFFSSQDDYAADETTSVEDDMKTSLEANTTIIQHGDSANDPSQYAITKIGIVLGAILAVILCLGCIFRRCLACCRRRERVVFVMENNAGERATEVRPQPVVAQPALNAPVFQHFPPEFSPEPLSQFPPHYQHQPIQPQPQHSPIQPGYQYGPIPQPYYYPVQQEYQQPQATLQFYNPPVAPPPYEDSLPNKF